MNIELSKQEIFKDEFIFAMTSLYGVDLNVTEELLEVIENIDFEALQQKLTADMETVLVYSVDCDKSYATSYRSEPLFETRAAKIVTIFERGCFSEITDEYETELWITEDYQFAVVKVFRIDIKGQYKTEFRTIKGYIPEQTSIFCTLDDFDSVVQRHIASYYEMESPICEI